MVRLGSRVVSFDVKSRSWLLGSVVRWEENEGWRGMCKLSSFRVKALQTRISHAFRRLLIGGVGANPKMGLHDASVGSKQKFGYDRPLVRHRNGVQLATIKRARNSCTNGAALILQILSLPNKPGLRQSLLSCPCTRHSRICLDIHQPPATDDSPRPSTIVNQPGASFL